MPTVPRSRWSARRSALVAALVVGAACSPTARAEGPLDAPANLDPGRTLGVGGVSLRPVVDLRLRGELRQQPVDEGGLVYDDAAVLSEGDATSSPRTHAIAPQVRRRWGVTSRAQLGVRADRGVVGVGLLLEDARWLGESTGPSIMGATAATAALPTFGPYQAFLEVHAKNPRKLRVRLGRQSVTWGDGRLLGDDDWAPAGAPLDALRVTGALGPVDLEGLGALLVAPSTALRGVPAAEDGATPRADTVSGPGAQLAGVRAILHLAPLLHAELAGLGRFVREPAPTWLVQSDAYVADLRVFGDHRGFRYAVEGAYEPGRVARAKDNRDLRAYAVAARASLETALPWHPTFGVRGAYASGDDGGLAAGDSQARFDPIHPATHDQLGLLDAFAWSNQLGAGADVSARPWNALDARVSYRFAALAQAGGRWTTADLVPVGAAPRNTARTLGHEVDVVLGVEPHEGLRLEAGWGVLLLGEGAEAVLRAAHRFETGERAAHLAFLQARASL